MERVILILAMLAGLHLILSFLRVAFVGIKSFLVLTNEPKELLELDLKTIDWRQYDVPAYVRRNGLNFDSGNNGKASFEVIA